MGSGSIGSRFHRALSAMGALGLYLPEMESQWRVFRGLTICFYLKKIILASVLRIQRWEERQRGGTTGLNKANEDKDRLR